MRVLEIIDKHQRMIYLTDERYRHILHHPEMKNSLEMVRETVLYPHRIIQIPFEKNLFYYYRYYKQRISRAKYLRVIVKYLNGEGFIITSYFVEHLS